MAKDISGAVGLTIGDNTTNIFIYEDNYYALVLEDFLPPKLTHHIKYYASNTICFRE